MDVETFRRKYMNGDRYFDFSKFSIICKKCNSTNVEFGGVAAHDSTDCWYPEDNPLVIVKHVCKCHDCGNAFNLCSEGVDDCLIQRKEKEVWKNEM